jgi:hypothetical protein
VSSNNQRINKTSEDERDMLAANFLIIPYPIKKRFTLRGKGPFEGVRNKALRKIFRLMRGEVTKNWRKIT